MLRKWISLLWVVCMLTGAGIRVQAAGETGTIRIQPQWRGEPAVGTEVQISRVGEVTDSGEYRFTDGLADWTVDREELHTGAWLQWLVQRDPAADKICVTGEEGALFRNLPSGVYLVRQTASDRQQPVFSPFFLTLPEGDCWSVFSTPKLLNHRDIPKTADRPTPLIGAMGIGLSVAFLMVLVDEHKK